MDLRQWEQAGTLLTVRVPQSRGGHRIFVQEQGKGPALLALHGFPTSSWDWAPIWPELTARFRCVAPDMLGFGFSDKPRAFPYSIAAQADVYEAVARVRGITECDILAHDYGDTVAQELLARHEAGGTLRIRSVCFLNGGIFPESHQPLLIQRLFASPLGPLLSRLVSRRQLDRSMRNVFGPSTQPDDQLLAQMWESIARAKGHRLTHKMIRYMQERAQHRARWVGPIVRNAVPIRLINGSADPISGAHLVARYRHLVPEADTVALPGIGHYPQIEAPREVAAAVLSFLAAVQAPSG